MTDGPFGSSLTSSHYADEGARVIRLGNIGIGEFRNEDAAYISMNYFGQLKRHEVRAGDLVIAGLGDVNHPVGRACIVPNEIGPAIVKADCFRVRLDERRLTHKYAMWALYDAASSGYTAELSHGSTRARINVEIARNILLPVPPVTEQRRIADFLDAETARIDALIRAGSRQVELIKDRNIEAIRHHTTTNEGTVRATGIPWMPAINIDWPLLKVGYHFLTGSGTTPTSSNASYFDGKYPWVNSGDLKDGIVEARSRVSDGAIRDFPALKLHPPGALVVAMYGQGETKGRVGILREASCVNQACCTLLPLDSISINFAFYWFRAHREGIVAQAYGAGQPNLSQQLIRQLKIPAPSIEKQKEITLYLASLERGMEHKMRRLETRSSLLAERRQALITAAVTGQFDVSTASGRGVTE